jgi:predicted metalloenzyme YecM
MYASIIVIILNTPVNQYNTVFEVIPLPVPAACQVKE